MENIIIRTATIADIDTLLVFEQSVVTAERPFDSTIKREYTRYYDMELMIHANHIQLLVAELDGEPIGCGYARIEEAKHYLQHTKHVYLGFMYVAPAHRGKGVNKLIVNELFKWSQSKSINEIRLDVYYENIAAIIAYEKAGFVKHMVEMRVGL